MGRVTIEFTETVLQTPYHHGGNNEVSKAKRREYLREYLPTGNAAKREKRLENYLSREFIAWDGEGVTRPDGKHVYVLLANSLGEHIVGTADQPLTTEACLRFLVDTANEHPKATHVIYGGSYDANMMLGDWSRGRIQEIYSRDYCTISNWRIGYRQGKSFHVRDMRGGRGITLYDVVSFFQCSFVKACDSYLGDSWPGRETVVREKANRSTFDIARIDDITRYCQLELDALILLMNELRERLFTAGLRLKRWDGPGACASALMMREKIKDAQDKTLQERYPEVARASRYAYAGGRFELVQFGHVDGSCYEYDVNSAYPAALLHVPNLQRGTWRHVVGKDAQTAAWDFALYHVQYRSDSFFAPSPLFRRDYNGTICYPPSVVGWYWTPEVRAALDYAQANGYECKILEAWVFEPFADTPKPFAFIEPMFERRRQWKREGNGAHVGIKLSLNSLYGKLAQQVGWRPSIDGKPSRIPPFHQLEWAGYVTSYTRAAVWRAIASDPENVIAFETDAVFTKRPLSVDIGSALGEWEETRFQSLTYLQSGFYFATTEDGKEICKSRGFDPDSVTRSGCLDALKVGGSVIAKQRRFNGMGIALAHYSTWRSWRKWVVLNKEITLAPSGKRTHADCQECNGTDNVALGVWHWTFCSIGFVMKHSAEFPIEWINPNEDMRMLTDFRHSGSAQWEALGNGDTNEFR